LPAQSADDVKEREILAPQFLSETPDDEYGEAAIPAREAAFEYRQEATGEASLSTAPPCAQSACENTTPLSREALPESRVGAGDAPPAAPAETAAPAWPPRSANPQDGVAAESLPAREMAPEYREEADSGRPDRFTDTAGAMLRAACPPEEPAPASGMEICIGQSRITIDLPEHLLQQSLSSTQENRFKLAGGLAAETLRKHPHLIESQTVDPVPIWVAIRDFVLNRMSHAAGV
jgi:hypothetical protein